MEFVTQAESQLFQLKSLLFSTVKIGPLADVIVGYVTTLDLEFERNVLIASWVVNSRSTYDKVLNDMSSSNVIRKYVKMVESYTPSRKFYHHVLVIDVEALTICHRATCYYPIIYEQAAGRKCTCGSSVVPIDYVKYI